MNRSTPHVAAYTPTSKLCDALTPRGPIDRALDIARRASGELNIIDALEIEPPSPAPFTASLLLIKADWSQSAAAKEIGCDHAAGDAADDALAGKLLADHEPELVVLCAGGMPPQRPIHSRNALIRDTSGRSTVPPQHDRCAAGCKPAPAQKPEPSFLAQHRCALRGAVAEFALFALRVLPKVICE